MSPHRTLIEVGPETIRRLCCGTSVIADAEMRAALEAIDDRVALMGERPVAVDSLWRTLLRSLHCEGGDGLTIVHPSWWPPSRVGVLTAAAPQPKDVAAQSRAWLLRQACGPDATVVEIADRMVAVAGAETVAVARTMQPTLVAHEVANLVAATMRPVVVIDAPVAGAAALATSIAEAVREGGAQTVIEVDDVTAAATGPASVAASIGLRQATAHRCGPSITRPAAALAGGSRRRRQSLRCRPSER